MADPVRDWRVRLGPAFSHGYMECRVADVLLLGAGAGYGARIIKSLAMAVRVRVGKLATDFPLGNERRDHLICRDSEVLCVSAFGLGGSANCQLVAQSFALKAVGLDDISVGLRLHPKPSPFSFMLANRPLAPITMWSSNSMSSSLPAARMSLVAAVSSGLGCGSPLGWL